MAVEGEYQMSNNIHSIHNLFKQKKKKIKLALHDIKIEESSLYSHNLVNRGIRKVVYIFYNLVLYLVRFPRDLYMVRMNIPNKRSNICGWCNRIPINLIKINFK